MAFLQKVLSIILVPVLEWLYGKISQAVKDYKDTKQVKAKIEEENRQARIQLEQAQTKEERERAIDTIRRKF